MCIPGHDEWLEVCMINTFPVLKTVSGNKVIEHN